MGWVRGRVGWVLSLERDCNYVCVSYLPYRSCVHGLTGWGELFGSKRVGKGGAVDGGGCGGMG